MIEYKGIKIEKTNMPATKFSISEHYIITLFPVGSSFGFKGKRYTVDKSGKPTCSKGEPKTDIYIRAYNENGEKAEFKITYKQENADFLENKTNAERAEQIFGENWSDIISNATKEIEDSFYHRPTIYKKASGRTEEGCITLGWKYELLNKKSGDLSAEVLLTDEQTIDVYAGTHLDAEKRHSKIGNEVIYDSGVANYLLFKNPEELKTAQDVIDNIISIEEYVKKEQPKIYFACKALNYRTKRVDENGNLDPKYDGNRPLSVYIEWSKKDDVLHADFVFDRPLENGGDYAFDQLWKALYEMGITTTDDIDEDNVDESVNIYD